MPSLIDEHTPFQGIDGKPLVNGKLYIGTQNADPVSNPITIYSDRALSTSITNPQTLDSYGRTTNKIWVPGPYSMRVDNSADVQQYQELDAGAAAETGITTLTNVQGTNTITAEGSPTAVTSLTDGQQYNFKAANANTGAVTLQIDLTAAKTIKKLHDVDLVSGDLEQNQVVSVVYNSTDDVFELVSNVAGLVAVDGLTFPATQVPSADANTLDDYEEGTWTPVLWDNDLNDSDSQAYTTQVGRYTKIGRIVYFEGAMVMSSLGTLTAGQNARIGGLPFTTSATDLAGGGALHRATNFSFTAGSNITLSAKENATHLEVLLWDATTGTSGLLISEITATSGFYFTGHFRVD